MPLENAETRGTARVARELDGILNVNKPAGLSSHDVVCRVRKITGQKKVGHAGTLDPLATGVLLICLGQATRVSQYLMSGSKTYRATIRLGISTDTYDSEGRITSQGPVDVTLLQIERVLEGFVGALEQTPPMYSALKHEGTPLYRLARRGETVFRPPRRIEISSVRLLNWASPDLEIEVGCSKGTYIRSLAHEVGQRLGCGGHLRGLTRTASGPFRLAEAVTLERLAEAFTRGEGGSLLLPSDAALADLPSTTVDSATADDLANGRRAALDVPEHYSLCRVYTTEGELLALAQPEGEGLWRPYKVFRRSQRDGPAGETTTCAAA
jgi:tRNA pseudouridine55 synthase